MNTAIGKSRESGQAVGIFLVLLLFVLFIIVIAGITFSMIKTIHRIVPQPPPDENGWTPGLGSLYDGGIVIGYTNAPRPAFKLLPLDSQPKVTVLIFAADVPNPSAWTNLIWSGPESSLSQVMGSNGLPMEHFAGAMPPSRFYNICVQTN